MEAEGEVVRSRRRGEGQRITQCRLVFVDEMCLSLVQQSSGAQCAEAEWMTDWQRRRRSR
jgi:hypothetical protein